MPVVRFAAPAPALARLLVACSALALPQPAS